MVVGGEEGKEDLQSAGIGVPASLVEVKTVVDNGLVVQELTAQDPVASHEAREMGANVADSARVVEIGEVRPVANS